MDTDVCLNYEIAERLSENYKPGKVEDGSEELKLKLENIIQSTNNFSDFTKINNDKNDKNNNDSRSADLIDGKQEVSSEHEDSGLKSDCSADSSSVSSVLSTVPSVSAEQSAARSPPEVAVKSGDTVDPASETVRKATSDSNSADTSDLVNDLSIISSTNLSSANSSFDSASFSTSDYAILNVKSSPATAPPSTTLTDAPDSPSPTPKANAQVLTSTPKQSSTDLKSAIAKADDPKSSDLKSGESTDKPRDSDQQQQQISKDSAAVQTSATAPKEPANKADAKNAKQIKDDSFKKDRSSFFPSLPKSSSAETISKLKSNISSVSTNSSNLFNKTITTISNNLTNITNKSRSRAADAKKQTPHQDARKQEVDKQPDKVASTAGAKQPVRAQTIDEERIMNAHAEDYGSLNCDHEPGLEFDDSELEQAAKLEDDHLTGEQEVDPSEIPYLIAEANGTNLTYLESYDDLLEENWNLEEALRDVNNEEDLNSFFSLEAMNTPHSNNHFSKNDKDFRELAKHGIIEMAGDDLFGRRIITIYACRLPPSSTIDHDKLLRYIMYTLDQYVENDYCLVYFHHGLTSINKPALSFLYKAYRAFDRRYKKNLKALYLVHPTKFIRFVLRLFKPLISVKFGKKVQYINHLDELDKHLRLEQIIIPKEVEEHDKKLIQSTKKPTVNASLKPTNKPPLPATQQFGVSLMFIKEHNNGDVVAPVVKTCIDYLNNEDALITEGLFRKSADTLVVRRVQERFNEGENVDLKSEFKGEEGYHIAAVLLKSFLRKLDEPLFKFELYDDIMRFEQIKNSKTEKLALVKSLILQRLPVDNYKLLKFIVKFLVKVIDQSNLNKMNAHNLGIIFGPNLVWSNVKLPTFETITTINDFTEFILDNHFLIFTK